MIDIIELRFKHIKTVAIRLAKNLDTVVSIERWIESKETHAMKKKINPSSKIIFESLLVPIARTPLLIPNSLYVFTDKIAKSKHIE